MATNTTNYNFKKPDESDFYSVQDQNNNWDKADAALKDLDTPTFEDYSGSTTVPDAASAINSIRSKGKLSAILSNMKAAFKGACLIGQIVNNCVTNNAKLPLSAAQGKALMDLYTQLNSDLGEVTNGNTQLKSKLYTGSAASGIVVTSRNNPISLENVSGQILAHIDSNQVGYVSTCPTNPVTFTIANGRVKMYVDNNLIGYLTTTTT
jgi:hypothetical protein